MTADLTRAQMDLIATRLREQGFDVDVESEDETDVECECLNDDCSEYDCPQVVWIAWNDWAIYDSGVLELECTVVDPLLVSSCELAAFVDTAHRAWHEATKTAQ